MPHILLTDKEFWKLHADFFGEGSGDCCEVDDTDLCYRVAKAQLKKVAEWLKNLPTDGHDKWYWYHQDLAEQLLKECE